MKLTLFSDHALRVLIHLAQQGDRLSSIRMIASRHGISRNHLMKVVQDLRKAGFVSSVRGRSGGIRLARPAKDITLGEVIRCTERNLHLENEASEPERSPLLTDMLQQAMAGFLASLDRHTIADLADRNCSESR